MLKKMQRQKNIVRRELKGIQLVQMLKVVLKIMSVRGMLKN